MIPLLLLLACQPADPDDGSPSGDGGTAAGDGGTPSADGGTAAGDGGATSADGGTAAPRWPTPALTLSTAVLDPTLDGASLTLQVALEDQAPAATCTVQVQLDHDRGLLDLGTASPGQELRWDGTDALGAPLPPGLATLWAFSSCDDGSRGSAELPFALVRLAPATVDLSTVDPADSQRLAFHKSNLVTDGVEPVDLPEYALAGAVFDDEAPVVAPWTDPDRPPWTDDPDAVARNVPAGMVAGATPLAAWTPAVDTWEGPAVPAGVTVTLVTPAAGPWQAAEAALSPLEATLGRGELALTWTWAACLGEGCTPVPVPGSRVTSHAVYRLAGPSQLRDGSAEGHADGTPWIGALADTVDAVQGIPADDPHAVMDALRDRIHLDDWIVYDPSDSDYSAYDGAYIYWRSITSDLSAWLDRRLGTHLYCHSVSCLLSVMGDHWGVDAEQIVLGVGFQTNLARAAGTDEWGRWYFNSHSVATLSDHALVWDASVDLDGDDDPYNSPAEALAPKSMPLDDYLATLTYDDIGIVNSGRCYYR
ncbi:hypothetical protein L6R53_11205 [Myxococcota bacterium]|nr:hypothetical protein [Myxococcota bacterium]